MIRKILSIDGGGLKGVLPASILAAVERDLSKPIGCYFDLIVGTSTGGIIALGLGAGLTAKEILDFYLENGPSIFAGGRARGRLRQLVGAKYSNHSLRGALERVLGERTMGDSATRLVIPSMNLDTGSVHIFKTPHHARLRTDYRVKMVDVAMATTAAPTYFVPFSQATGAALVDGGVYANNPAGLAVVEAISMMRWAPPELKLLSLGCTTEVVNYAGLERAWRSGLFFWAPKALDAIMAGQSSLSLGTAQHLAGHANVTRISPQTPHGRFALDSTDGMRTLQGLGESCAREYGEVLAGFVAEEAEPFEPLYPQRST